MRVYRIALIVVEQHVGRARRLQSRLVGAGVSEKNVSLQSASNMYMSRSYPAAGALSPTARITASISRYSSGTSNTYASSPLDDGIEHDCRNSCAVIVSNVPLALWKAGWPTSIVIVSLT